MKLLAIAVTSIALLIPFTEVSSAHHLDVGRTPCKEKYTGVKRTKCYIKRAAAHFGQSTYEALATAWCESRYNPFADTNPPYVGIYQFDYPTWQGAPYPNKSRYSARYSALNAMWYWKQGQRSRWPVCG